MLTNVGQKALLSDFTIIQDFLDFFECFPSPFPYKSAGIFITHKNVRTASEKTHLTAEILN